MSYENDEPDLSRRRFLRAAALTAVAATTAGAGAAHLTRQLADEATVTTVTSFTTNASLPKPLPGTGNPADEALLQAAALRAENVRLQNDLAAAQTRLAALETSSDARASQTEVLTVQLNEAQQRLSLMAGLVALYEELDEVDVGAALTEGLTAVGESFEELLAEVPELNEGIAMGRAVLDELDDHIPLLESGRFWLGERLSRLHMYYEALERVLAAAVDAVGPFLHMFNEWVQKVLKWLPFGLGQKSGAVMNALTDLLTETPDLMAGLENRLVYPLDVWLGNPNEEAPLRRRLIQPMQRDVLDKTTATLAQAEGVKTAYQEKVKMPAETAVAQRQTLHLLIDQYRQQHQI